MPTKAALPSFYKKCFTTIIELTKDVKKLTVKSSSPNFGAGWRWMVSCTLQSLYLQRMIPQYPMDRRLD